MNGNKYITLGDGAWCWFSDPRGIYDESSDSLFVGWTNSNGDIVVGKYSPDEKITTKIILRSFQKNDHTSPSLLFLPDKRIIIFFTQHNGKLFYTISKHPADISEFEQVKNINAGERITYTNPVMLSKENNRIYLFIRESINFKPAYIYSDDLGKSWSKVFPIFKPSIKSRPYTKIVSDGKSTIHFAFTDGHPQEEKGNSIYYLKYDGNFENLPIDINTLPKVYNGNESPSWIWDIAIKNNNPVIVYATFPRNQQHQYNYSVLENSHWKNKLITKAGISFINSISEPAYSGGIYVDHDNPNVVYLSKPINRIFEIEKWKTLDKGENWVKTMITKDSKNNNVRPFVISSKSDILFYMNNIYYNNYDDYKSCIRCTNMNFNYEKSI